LTTQAGNPQRPADSGGVLDLSGDWQGSLSAGAVPLRLVFHLRPAPDGGWKGTMDSPDQNARGIPIGAVALRGHALELAFPAFAAGFEGTVADDGKSVAGNWKQAGSTFPLTLVKSAGPVAEPRRPQRPRPPYPYVVRELKFPSVQPGVVLAGTVCVPRGKGPFPAVVMVTGSGPQDRDEFLLGHRPFHVIADHLARHGIASLRYDDRGVGASGGDPTLATSDDFALDAEGAVRALRALPDIRKDRVGILGHSEGGLIGPLAARRTKDIAFLVLLAGPGLPGKDVMVSQMAALLKAAGNNDADVAKSVVLQRTLVDIAAGPGSVDDRVRRMGEAADRFAEGLNETERVAFANARKGLDAQLRTLASPWFRRFLNHDPRPVLAGLRVPVLALHGSLDLQVDANSNAAAIREALRKGRIRGSRVEILPGLNHLFQTCRTGLPAEYGTIEETFAPVALARIVAFVREATGTKKTVNGARSKH